MNATRGAIAALLLVLTGHGLALAGEEHCTGLAPTGSDPWRERPEGLQIQGEVSTEDLAELAAAVRLDYA